MATVKQIDNALELLNNMLKNGVKVRFDGKNLYYQVPGSITRKNIQVENPTKSHILEIIWAMQTAVDIKGGLKG